MLLSTSIEPLGYEKGTAMSADTTAQDEVIIACNPNPIPPEQRERWLEVAALMYGAVQEVQELPDGYAFRLPSSPEMLLIVAEDLNIDRLCCPFLRFTLDIEPNGGPYWLRFTGGEGVKEFLRMSFESSSLLDEQVAQAAGFSIANRTDLDSVEAALQAVDRVNEQFARAAGART
jgi:hypothetical protein